MGHRAATDGMGPQCLAGIVVAGCLRCTAAAAAYEAQRATQAAHRGGLFQDLRLSRHAGDEEATGHLARGPEDPTVFVVVSFALVSF